MSHGNITYYRSEKEIEYIYCQNFDQSYPMHTHANHVVAGYVLEGGVCIVCRGEKYLYYPGEWFVIEQDMPHAIEPIEKGTYSMISVCMPVDRMVNETEAEGICVKSLKQSICALPEKPFPIQEMADSIAISPYHMIRQFKEVCGLTPHQFQIQCRVRKGQRLLEEGRSVIEAAYATGFCDQSHFDRCFRKIVRLTPHEYRQAVRQSV